MAAPTIEKILGLLFRATNGYLGEWCQPDDGSDRGDLRSEKREDWGRATNKVAGGWLAALRSLVLLVPALVLGGGGEGWKGDGPWIHDGRHG